MVCWTWHKRDLWHLFNWHRNRFFICYKKSALISLSFVSSSLKTIVLSALLNPNSLLSFYTSLSLFTQKAEIQELFHRYKQQKSISAVYCYKFSLVSLKWAYNYDDCSVIWSTVSLTDSQLVLLFTNILINWGTNINCCIQLVWYKHRSTIYGFLQIVTSIFS